jgi:hypothetical protein
MREPCHATPAWDCGIQVGSQEALISRKIRHPAALQLPRRAARERAIWRPENGGNPAGDLGLDLHQRLDPEFAVEAGRPDIDAVLDVQQLGRDPDATRKCANAALKHEADRQVAADLAGSLSGESFRLVFSASTLRLSK